MFTDRVLGNQKHCWHKLASWKVQSEFLGNRRSCMCPKCPSFALVCNDESRFHPQDDTHQSFLSFLVIMFQVTEQMYVWQSLQYDSSDLNKHGSGSFQSDITGWCWGASCALYRLVLPFSNISVCLYTLLRERELSPLIDWLAFGFKP
jgi:hypothetical protein